MTEEWLTIPDAAKHYGITENAMRQRIKRRRGAGTEKRGGIIFVKVEISDQPTGRTADSLAQQAIQAADQPGLAEMRRLAEAMERHNELLARLLELDAEPLPEPTKRRWPWQRPN